MKDTPEQTIVVSRRANGDERGARGKTPPGVLRVNNKTLSSGNATAMAERLNELAYADAEAVLSTLESGRNGLTNDEVGRRRAEYGRSEVAHEKPPTCYAELGRAFANPFNFLLTVLAVFSSATGDHEAMTLIVFMVVFSTYLRFIQEFRSNKSAQALRALVRTTTAVERAGDEFDPTGLATRCRDILLSYLALTQIVKT